MRNTVGTSCDLNALNPLARGGRRAARLRGLGATFPLGTAYASGAQCKAVQGTVISSTL